MQTSNLNILTAGYQVGDYLDIVNSKRRSHAIVILITDGSNMTIRYYTRWQWFWIKLGMLCGIIQVNT